MKFSWRTFSIYPCTMTVKLCHHVSDVLAFLFIENDSGNVPEHATCAFACLHGRLRGTKSCHNITSKCLSKSP